MTRDETVEYLRSLEPGMRVVETGECAMKGRLGTVYLNEKMAVCVCWDQLEGEDGPLGTSATWGTRRVTDVIPEKITEAAKNNPILFSVMSHYDNGEIPTYQEALEEAVLRLCEENSKIIDDTVKCLFRDSRVPEKLSAEKIKSMPDGETIPAPFTEVEYIDAAHDTRTSGTQPRFTARLKNKPDVKATGSTIQEALGQLMWVAPATVFGLTIVAADKETTKAWADEQPRPVCRATGCSNKVMDHKSVFCTDHRRTEED
jgi:hypothetical protein